MQLFYNPELQIKDQQFTFDKIESRHIIRVLRKKEGEQLHITNGKGYLFTSKIIDASDKKCKVAITNIEEKEKPRNYYLHIAIAPTKNNDRFEWFLEKATEIGIDEITPIICDHSERKVVKIERLQKIIEAAGKQSLKFHFPKLNTPLKFTDFISTVKCEPKFIAHCDPSVNRFPLVNLLKNEKDTLLLIGPEGDFSSSEIQSALDQKFVPVMLSESRLRTETAGIHATSLVACINTKK
ncbi:MAG: 16S rRNA (uracil(1498)-N(3))-methyltransferase [Flavobacteriaceae bacterium]|nr:16S rRNA (uracil(1498)-N(3))-methyltransferase [Flavobacteriaceae bacterium]